MLWNNLENSLRGIYQEFNIGELNERESEYLERALIFTEDLWNKQFESIGSICFVMLGEAPLFGAQKSYFYNPRSAFTSFFKYSDIKPEAENEPIICIKNLMFECLKKHNFIILDLFPYALNSNYTKISYGRTMRPRVYERLLSGSYKDYLYPKLKKIKMKNEKKGTKFISFVTRYRRMGVLENFLRPKLIDLKLLASDRSIPSVGSLNFPIDREELKRQYEERCGPLIC